MAIKKINPLTPGQRFKVVTTFDDVTSAKPEKSLTKVRWSRIKEQQEAEDSRALESQPQISTTMSSRFLFF